MKNLVTSNTPKNLIQNLHIVLTSPRFITATSHVPTGLRLTVAVLVALRLTVLAEWARVTLAALAVTHTITITQQRTGASVVTIITYTFTRGRTSTCNIIHSKSCRIAYNIVEKQKYIFVIIKNNSLHVTDYNLLFWCWGKN